MKMIPGAMALLFGGLFVLSSFAVAEEKEREKGSEVRELEEISVTATRTERKAQEVPASVVIVGEEDLKETKMFNLKEALTGAPGVLIDTRNQGYDSRLIIRGAGLKARYGVRDIMVLLNGVPITDPDSFTRLDFVDTQLIESIEVVKGPNSTLWGANAAGGIINITTKSPFRREGGSIKVGAGDFDTQNYQLSYSNNLSEKLFFTVSGSRRESDNSWRRWNKFWTNQFSIQPSVILDDGTTWENNLSYTKASLQLPGKLDEDMFEKYKATGEATETEGPWQFMGRYSEIFFFSSKLSKEIGNFELKPIVFLNKWTHHHPVTGRINDADTTTFGTDFQINNKHMIGGINGTLTTGVTARYDDQKTDYFEYAEFLTGFGGRISEVLSDRTGSLLEKQDRKTLLWGLYAQESIRVNRMILDVGVRFDKVKFDISGTKWGDYDWSQGKYISYSPAQDYSVDKTYNAVSPRVGVTYKLTDIFNLYGNASMGVQTPTEEELTDNPDLDLVNITNYEMGLKARHKKWTFDTAIYYSPVRDEIVKVIQEGITEYVNAGQTEKRGFEFSGAYRLYHTLKIGASYSYSDYKFDEFTEPVRVGPTTVNVDRSGNRMPYIPKHQYSLFAHYRHPSGLKFRVQTHTWGSYYMDNANTEKYGGYDFLTNMMIGYEKGNVDVVLNVDNIFDQRYAVEVEKDTSLVRRYSPASPRSFVVRLTYNF
jgi:iron complex outermembrane receptor protein